MKDIKYHIKFTFLSLLVFVPVFVMAQVDSGALRDSVTYGLVPCGNPGQARCNVLHFFSLFGRIINFLIALSGFFAVFQIARAGFTMVFAFGSEQGITAGKDSLVNAVVGLCLVMMAYLIVNLVIVGVLDVKYADILKNPFGNLCKAPTMDASGQKIVNCY